MRPVSRIIGHVGIQPRIGETQRLVDYMVASTTRKRRRGRGDTRIHIHYPNGRMRT